VNFPKRGNYKRCSNGKNGVRGKLRKIMPDEEVGKQVRSQCLIENHQTRESTVNVSKIFSEPQKREHQKERRRQKRRLRISDSQFHLSLTHQGEKYRRTERTISRDKGGKKYGKKLNSSSMKSESEVGKGVDTT